MRLATQAASQPHSFTTPTPQLPGSHRDRRSSSSLTTLCQYRASISGRFQLPAALLHTPRNAPNITTDRTTLDLKPSPRSLKLSRTHHNAPPTPPPARRPNGAAPTPHRLADRRATSRLLRRGPDADALHGPRGGDALRRRDGVWVGGRQGGHDARVAIRLCAGSLGGVLFVGCPYPSPIRSPSLLSPDSPHRWALGAWLPKIRERRQMLTPSQRRRHSIPSNPQQTCPRLRPNNPLSPPRCLHLLHRLPPPQRNVVGRNGRFERAGHRAWHVGVQIQGATAHFVWGTRW